VFHEEKRAFYSLEDLWGDAPRIEWEKMAKVASASGR
jgi:ribosome-associated protein